MNRQVMRLLVVAVLSFILGGRVLAGSFANPAGTPSSGNNNQVSYTTTAGSPVSVADIVAAAGPAVVYIESDISASNSPAVQGFWGWYVPQQAEKATGTGFIIDANGYILTNQHVVEGATNISIKLKDQDKAYTASIVGQDHDLDLALLKINATTKLPAISLGDSDAMRIGDPVIAIGNPLGLDHTVTTGVVSAKGRPITIQDRSYKNLIQTDAAINPGNSGGPLINMQGQVIAINTAISADAQGIGFAIPINTAKSIIQELIKNGKVIRPYLGVSMEDITPAIAEQMHLSSTTKGVAINQIVPNSPASTAGVKSGDILTSIDGNLIDSGTKVQDYILKQEVGKTVKLGILRNGLPLTITATLKEQP